MRRFSGPILTLLAIGIASNAIALKAAQRISEFDRGVKAYDGKQYKLAYKIWWDIKDEDLAAMRNVALMLRKGQGIPKDPKRAEDLLKIAAATGMPNAEVDLAEMYLAGEAGAPDPRSAALLLYDAANAGHPLAQFLLGELYEDGNGVPKDSSKAIQLYTKSAQGGVYAARARLASLGVDQASKPSSKSDMPVTAKVKTSRGTREATAGKLAPSVYVQLGSFKNIDAAELQWSRLHQLSALVTAAHKSERVDLGQRGVWFRLLVVEKDQQSAASACKQVSASGKPCLVWYHLNRQ